MILNLSKLEVYRAGSVLPLKQISNTGERFVPMLIFSTRIDCSWFYITQPSRKTGGAIFAPTPTLFLLLNFALSCFLTLYFFLYRSLLLISHCFLCGFSSTNFMLPPKSRCIHDVVLIPLLAEISVMLV